MSPDNEYKANDGAATISGATFGIFEKIDEDESGKPVFSDTPVQSVETTDQFEDYIELNPGTYVLKEIDAPDGYSLTNREYYFTVKETKVYVYFNENTATKKHEFVAVSEKKPLPDADKTNLEVMLPRIEVTVFSSAEMSESNVLAKYMYSAFRANQRTYKIGDSEVKFGLFLEEESMLTGTDSITVDGKKYTYDQAMNDPDLKTFIEDIELVHISELDREENEFIGNEAFEAYVVFYKGEPVFPVVTLNRVLEENDNQFFGFNFFDKRALTIKKVDVDHKLLPDAEIELYLESYTSADIVNSSDELDAPIWTWNSSKSAIELEHVKGLNDEDGKYIYRLHEKSAPEGYDLAEKDTLFAVSGDKLYVKQVDRDAPAGNFPPGNGWTEYGNITDRENRVIEIENVKSTGAKIKFVKTDTDGNKIGGAEFELFSESNDKIGKIVVPESGEIDLRGIDFGEDGNDSYVQNGSLIPGVYYLVETQAPSGYKKLEEPLYFTVDNNFNITSGSPGEAKPDSYEFSSTLNDWGAKVYQYFLKNKDGKEIKENTNGVLTVNNVEKIVLEFNNCHDNFDNNDDSKHFKFYTTTNKLKVIGLQWFDDYNGLGTRKFLTLSDNNEGKPFTFEEGHFEIQSPDWSNLLSVTFYIQGDPEDGNPALDISGNTITIKNQPDGYMVGVSKVGSDNENEFLPGATLELYKIGDNNQEELITTATSTDQLLKFAVKEGSYVIREKAAPAGYEISDDAYYFTVSKDDITDSVSIETTTKTAHIFDTTTDQSVASDVTANPDNYIAIGTQEPWETFTWQSETDFSKNVIYQLFYTYNSALENLIDSIKFTYKDGTYYDARSFNDLNYRGFDKDGNYINEWYWTMLLGNIDDVNFKNDNIVKIEAIMRQMDYKEATIIIQDPNNNWGQYKDRQGQDSWRIYTSPDKQEVFTILEFPKPDPITKYYKKASEGEIASGNAVQLESGEWVVADVDTTTTSLPFSAPKLKLTVTHGVTETVTFDPTNVSDNTYTVYGVSYTITMDGDKISAISPENSAIMEDLTAIKVNGGHAIVYKGTIVYPDFMQDGYLLTKKLTNSALAVNSGIKVVNTKETDEPDKPIEPEHHEIKISKKIFGTTDELSGATLQLTHSDANVSLADIEVSGGATEISKSDNTITWKSGGTPAVFKDLPDGTYTLTEIEVPDGYKRAADITFEVQDGKITEINGTGPKNDGLVEMFDEKSSVSIKKVGERDNDKNGLAGAEFELTLTKATKNENATLENVTASCNADTTAEVQLTFAEDKKSFTWISGVTAVTFTGLPDGEYTLIEKNAPDGYTVREATKFKIVDGVVTVTQGETGEDGVILVKDKLSEIIISKQNLVNKDKENYEGELAGAEFKLTLDESSTATLRYDMCSLEATLGDKGKSLTWISGAAPATFKGLPDGNYTLKELNPPSDEYETLEGEITFTIDNGEITNSSFKSDDDAEISGKLIRVFNKLKVVEEPGVEMPSAGGGGTLPYQTVGLTITGLTVLALTLTKRRREQNI